MLSREEHRQLLLAGTVTFPATFPQLGLIHFLHESLTSGKTLEMISVTERPSPRVTLVRRIKASSVRAIFLPRDPQHVHYSDGRWLLGSDICEFLSSSKNGVSIGIVFVPESEPSLLHMTAGMNAAESIQYYPPLPGDPSHNHYNPFPAGRRHVVCGGGSCVQDDTNDEQLDRMPCRSCTPFQNEMEECGLERWSCSDLSSAGPQASCDDVSTVDWTSEYLAVARRSCGEVAGYPLPDDEHFA
jgi:hypothetical protein